MGSNEEGDSSDPFAYKPLRKRRKALPGRVTASQPVGRGSRKVASRPTPQRSPIKDAFRTQSQLAAAQGLHGRDMDTFCCFCQMPLNLLPALESRHRHQEMCLEISFSQLPECPDGLLCRQESRTHFSHWNHFELAQFRDTSSVAYPPEISTPRAGQIVPESPERSGSPSILAEATDTPASSPELAHETNAEAGGPEPTSESTTHLDEPVSEKGTSTLDSDLARSSSPVQIRAERNESRIEVQIRVDETAQLRSMTVQIPSTDEADRGSRVRVLSTTVQPVHLRPIVPVVEAKKIFDHIFQRSRKPEPAVRDQVTRMSDELLPRRETNNRTCPFYRKIPNTSFVVDAFSYGSIPGAQYYFLSHFHYDHYNGLRSSFSHPIVCSPITARMIALKIKVNPKFVRALPLDEAIVIENVELTLLEANHCPGAVMFLFKFTSGYTVLHCGDFRATPLMEEHPALWNNSIDRVYLDTTYCQPDYDFPTQSNVIQTTLDLVESHLERHPKTLVVVGTYTIGKERIFTALADKFNWKIWASTEKTRILHVLQDPIIDRRLVKIPAKAQLHVIEMKRIRGDQSTLKQYLHLHRGAFTHMLAIIPTGWTHSRGSTSETSLKSLKIKGSGELFTLEVPYSEHSSYSELERFIKFLKLPNTGSIIPTVNVGTEKSRSSMKKRMDDRKEAYVAEPVTAPTAAGFLRTVSTQNE
eukprot:snap_masked-scaffold605_size125465-processed-gene-0.16 protein:Tk06877 transcript:snap_masked-scaffold605_size125465-processed-gene-0.16-mRNA-1 annotation:"dna cross-link repair 1a protein"